MSKKYLMNFLGTSLPPKTQNNQGVWISGNYNT